MCSDVKRASISIHALCEEGDIWERTEERTDEYFYPRPLRGGRLPGFFLASETGKISIHALCEEGDSATGWANMAVGISIHALCEEGDVVNLVE